ncbi:MAG: PEP/pyruvate-binding domain-containing protein [Nanoarchaeota archaeon]|nr:PEP/pyruvate-binding domain-containing protein [Nanoarchaeota archaeon]
MPQNESSIEIIGKGNIGDKARQLIEKTPTLRKIGFSTPYRMVLAEDFFNGFFQKNNIGNSLSDVKNTENLEEKIKRGGLDFDEFLTLKAVSEMHGSFPLVVRSSAEGDSRGTGTYKSEFCDNEIPQIRKALTSVLASYFSESAVAFRRDANTGEGFGIIIEPLISQNFDSFSAPVISGFGYTSTARGPGYINAVPGIGGGVDTKDGERITKDAVKPFKGNLQWYLIEEIGDMCAFNASKVMKKSALLKTDSGLTLDQDYNCSVYYKSQYFKQHGEICRSSLNLKDLLEKINILDLFKMMDKMEKTLKKPQYFEWAATVENEKVKYWITQIADVNKKLDMMDFEDLGEIMFMGHTVTGTGIKECNKIANCWNPDEVESLYQFNKENKDYLLIFSSRLTYGGFGPARKLRYGDFSNAAAFLEIQDARHNGDPVAHLGGQLELAGKLFGVMDYDAEVEPN